MPEIVNIFVAIALLTASLAAYFLTIQVLFAGRVAKTKTIIQSLPGRSFGIGLVNFTFFMIVAIVLLSISDKIENGFFKAVVMLPGLIILTLIAIMLTFGLAAMSVHMGEKIITDAASTRQTISGTVCICFACALPFIGWYLLFPYIGLVGIGAFILGIFQREPKS
jgi:hypothetical protein